jgi:hypothetical protein
MDMKKLFFVACAAVLMALGTVQAHAADVTGKWTADMQMPGGGDSMQLAFTFTQDGAALSGSVLGPQGDAMPIADGKVDGDRISFKVSFNGMTISHEGTINAAGDEIKLTSKSDSGDFPGMEMTLKKVKAAPVPVTISVPAAQSPVLAG